MLGRNITKCASGECVYGETVCCYECDHRIQSICEIRCIDSDCRSAMIEERIFGKAKAPHGERNPIGANHYTNTIIPRKKGTSK